ncbi:class I SAM-dependent methyltransferase [Nocardioides sp. Bht2]|uniref:class I SAM-dependent methyltransferase n=1 Tax=Nocardioides sp. Bht2 TaxID=3392297 RepID=UPI0039B603DA
MTFEVPRGVYDRFMGRYTLELAPQLVDAAAIARGMRVLDVGCGPGGLTEVLAAQVGDQRLVAAIDPSAPFVLACRAVVPDADVRQGVAEDLPWPADLFDAALSSLVVGFMRDPERGMAEMARVTASGGTVTACFWDVPRHGMLALAERAISTVRPDLEPHPPMVGMARDDIPNLMTAAGLTVEASGELEVRVDYADFGDFWEPVSRAPGPIGEALAQLSEQEQVEVERVARAALPVGPFELPAYAWYAVGRV